MIFTCNLLVNYFNDLGGFDKLAAGLHIMFNADHRDQNIKGQSRPTKREKNNDIPYNRYRH